MSKIAFLPHPNPAQKKFVTFCHSMIKIDFKGALVTISFIKTGHYTVTMPYRSNL